MTDLHQFSDAEEEEEAPKPYKVRISLKEFSIKEIVSNFWINLSIFLGKFS